MKHCLYADQRQVSTKASAEYKAAQIKFINAANNNNAIMQQHPASGENRPVSRGKEIRCRMTFPVTAGCNAVKASWRRYGKCTAGAIDLRRKEMCIAVSAPATARDIFGQFLFVNTRCRKSVLPVAANMHHHAP